MFSSSTGKDYNCTYAIPVLGNYNIAWTDVYPIFSDEHRRALCFPDIRPCRAELLWDNIKIYCNVCLCPVDSQLLSMVPQWHLSQTPVWTSLYTCQLLPLKPMAYATRPNIVSQNEKPATPLMSIRCFEEPWVTCVGIVAAFWNKMWILDTRCYFSFPETQMSSFWRNFQLWLHWKLSFWQLPVVKTSNSDLNISK